MATNGRTLLRLFGIAADPANSTRSSDSHTAVSASLWAFRTRKSSNVRSPTRSVIFSWYSTCGVTSR